MCQTLKGNMIRIYTGLTHWLTFVFIHRFHFMISHKICSLIVVRSESTSLRIETTTMTMESMAAMISAISDRHLGVIHLMFTCLCSGLDEVNMALKCQHKLIEWRKKRFGKHCNLEFLIVWYKPSSKGEDFINVWYRCVDGNKVVIDLLKFIMIFFYWKRSIFSVMWVDLSIYIIALL